MAARKRKISCKEENSPKNNDNNHQIVKSSKGFAGWNLGNEKDEESVWEEDEDDKDYNYQYRNDRVVDNDYEEESDGEGGDGARFAKWLGNAVYKQITNLMSFYRKDDSDEENHTVDQRKYRCQNKEDDKCSQRKFNGHEPEKSEGILKKSSSVDSALGSYLKSEMNQVAAYIVGSAIRFGKDHGVVVPDNDQANLYHVRLPVEDRNKSSTKAIRFQIPENVFGYEDAKKAMWRSENIDSVRYALPAPSAVHSAHASHPPLDRRSQLNTHHKHSSQHSPSNHQSQHTQYSPQSKRCLLNKYPSRGFQNTRPSTPLAIKEKEDGSMHDSQDEEKSLKIMNTDSELELDLNDLDVVWAKLSKKKRKSPPNRHARSLTRTCKSKRNSYTMRGNIKREPVSASRSGSKLSEDYFQPKSKLKKFDACSSDSLSSVDKRCLRKMGKY